MGIGTGLRIALIISLLLACGDDSSSPDATAGDAGTDAPGDDSGADDAGGDDAGDDDAGAEDAGDDDAGAEDSGLGTAMSFFVSSTPVSGDGDLGGIEGADAHCVALAEAAGAERTAWVAYLSTSEVDAIDRIGSGPWYNFDGDVFAADLDSLHPTIDPSDDRDGYIAVKPADELFMDENGDSIPGNEHDIFTGTQADGTHMDGATCQDWTSNDADDVAQVGHSDTPGNPAFSPSWNSAHESAGCDTDGVEARGGNGRVYCFATD